METVLYSFKEIFNTKYEINGEIVTLNKIVIPIIQRDYAQGRDGHIVKRIRECFLNALYTAVVNQPITLDFIYGDIDENGILIPLDGQQRLTTLFLLHWFAAKKEGVFEKEYEFLNRFSYETRYSARDFCSCLVKFRPGFDEKVSDEIMDQPWFPLSWTKDPTISSMMVVLDAIQSKFSTVENLWGKLKNGAITFYFLPIKDMGLTDELYITMNSRGKPLTNFEHFKAELERTLKEIDEEIAKRILLKIDTVWTDLLWLYKDTENIVDNAFLKYFHFICDILCYKSGNTPQSEDRDEFELIKKYFSPSSDRIKENISFLERCYDCWSNLKEKSNDFFGRFISEEHQKKKIVVQGSNVDIFADCLENYGIRRKFPLNRVILLYAFIVYLLSEGSVEEIAFIRRLRIINNLILNSENEISDSVDRDGGNRMPAILQQVDSIIVNGMINFELSPNFSVVQLKEEEEKMSWVQQNPDKSEKLFELEDHPLLFGQIGIIGLENEACFSKFEKLFACDWNQVDRALMSIGFYGQQESCGWRYQLGSSRVASAWQSLFHKSRNSGFERTHEILVALLSKIDVFENDGLKRIVDSFLCECVQKNEFPWSYYYIKYPAFRPGSYGKYHNNTSETYKFSVMQTQRRTSDAGTFDPFLYSVFPEAFYRIYGEEYLNIAEKRIYSKNDEFLIDDRKLSNERENTEKLKIPQNANGIDTEDRIQILKTYLEKNHLL